MWEHLGPETEKDFLCQEWALNAMVPLWMDGSGGRCVSCEDRYCTGVKARYERAAARSITK